jgi:hypothetical protein
MDDVYNPTRICATKLTNLITQISLKYGASMKKLVGGMLENNPKARITLKQIKTYIESLDIPGISNT